MDNTIPNTTDGPVAMTGVETCPYTFLIHPVCVYTDIERALKAADRLDNGAYKWTVTPDIAGSFLVFTKTLVETGETAGTYVVPCNCGAPTKKDIVDNIVPFLNGIGVSAAPANVNGRTLPEETPRKLSLETEEALLSYGRFIKHGPYVTIDVTDSDGKDVMQFTISADMFNGFRNAVIDRNLLKLIRGADDIDLNIDVESIINPVRIGTKHPFDDINSALAVVKSPYRAVVGVSDDMKEVCRISKAGMGGASGVFEVDLNSPSAWDTIAGWMSRVVRRRVVVTKQTANGDVVTIAISNEGAYGTEDAFCAAKEEGHEQEAASSAPEKKISIDTEEALLSYGKFIKHGPHVTIDVTDGDKSTVMRFTVSCKAFNESRSEGGDDLLKFIGGVPGACSGCCAFPDDAPVCIHTECPFDDINIALAYTGSEYRAVVGVSDDMKEVCRISKAGMGDTYYEADLNADGVWQALADVVSRHTDRKVVVTTSKYGLTITEAESDACNHPVAVAVAEDVAACPEQEDPASGIDVVDYNQNTEGLWEEDRVNLQFENKGPYTHVSVRDKDSGRVLRRMTVEYRRGVPLTFNLCTRRMKIDDGCRKQVEVMHLETIAADANWILSLYGSSHCVTVVDKVLCVSENGLEGEDCHKYRWSDLHLAAFKNYVARLAGIACVELVKKEDGKLYALKPFTGEDKAAEFKMRGCTGVMGYPLWCSGAPTVAMGLRVPRWVHAVLGSDVWDRSENAHGEVHPNIDSAEKLVRYVYEGDRSNIWDDIPLLIMDRPYPEYPCAPSDCGEVNIRKDDPVAADEEPQAEREPDLDRCVNGPVEVCELENLLVSADRGALASIDWFVRACASSKIPSTTIMSAGAECSIMVNRTGNGYVTVSIHDIKSGKDVYRIALEAEDASSFLSERVLDDAFVAGHGSLAPATPKVGVIRAGHEVADVNRLLLHAKTPGMCATVTALTRTLNISFFGVGADVKSYALNGERERNAAMEELCRDVERLTGIETCVYTRRVAGTDLGEPFARTEMLVSGQWLPIVLTSELMRDGSLGNLNSYLLKGGSCDPCIVTRNTTLSGKKGLRTVNAMGRYEDASYLVDTVEDAFETLRRLSIRFYGLRDVRLIDDVSVVEETSTGEENGK